MLSSVWNKFVPGGRSRQTHEAQQTALEIRGDSLSTAPNAEVRGENAGASVSPAPKPFADHLCNCAAAGCKSVDSVCICSVQQPVCTCLVSGNDCASDNCGCIGLRHGHSCANCSCVCSNREPNGANVKIDHSDADGSMADYGAQQCSGQQQSPTEVHSGPQAHRSKADRADIISRSAGSDCLPAPHSSSCDMNPLQDHQKTASHEGNTQHQQHWSASSSPLPVEKGSAMSNRSDSGHPEGWEHIRSDDIQAACMRNEEAMQTGNAYGDEPRRETVTPGEQDWRTNKASGSIAGWNSPPPEFEFVADGPWCDVSRLLRLSSRQQPRGWEWACSGLASALLRDRSNSNNHAEAVAALGEADDAGEDAAVAAASERTGRQGCPVVRLLRSAMYSTMFSGSEFIRRHGTLGKATAGTEANSASESPQANPTGWGGRWQLTPFDYPRDSFTSCSSSDSRRGSVPVPPVALSVEDGESSSGSQGSSFESHSQLLHGSAGGSDAVRPRSPVGSPSLAASSGTQRGTLAADEGNATVYPDSAHVASEVQASCSATEISDPAESGRCRASAQQHIETQCRKKLKKNDMRLNILITALPGVDTDVFCRQMFAEWQEVSRQRVSCGEEFVFRSPFVVPFVEVPVIAATSFASALPYCELRLLEEWTRDAVLQQEATERRVHICLFLIPHLALPLSTGVLALLKRLRAVACMLPLLIVQQTTSNEQILRDRGVLRLQLAASDLATLEEMLLPLRSTTRVRGACAHCQRKIQQKECQPSEVHSKPEPPLSCEGFCSSDTANAGKCPSGTNTQERRTQPPDDYSESINNSCSSVSSKRSTHGQPICVDSTSPDIRERRTLKPYDSAESNSRSSGSSRKGSHGQSIDGECAESRRGDKVEGESALASRNRRNMQNFSRAPLCLSAVHLPLVLQLPLNGTNCGTDSRCTCGEGIGGFSEGVTTPLSLRGMLVEASAVLLRQRAEYGCFLPFLFQQQMLPNRTNKLRGLQQWEDEEKQQREQQQHVEALVDLRQVQIDTHPNTETAMHMQRQLDGLRKQLRKMQQQLLHLQERRFLQELLREEAAAARPYPSPHGRVLLQNSDAEPGEREELLSQVAQTGLVLALMLGVGALLFNSMKRGSC